MKKNSSQTIKIFSWNVNGIRAVEKKNSIQKFISEQQPDILFLQETKAEKAQLSAYLTENEEYDQFYHAAEKKGYSGVGVWIKKNIFSEMEISTGMHGWNDIEGRIIQVISGKNIFLGVYFPNGGKSPAAWDEKLRFYDHFLQYVNDLREAKNNVIWCGDLNVAHNEIDLARPKENLKSIGFLPEERAWMDRVTVADWIDIFRHTYPTTESYTWWSMQTRARERNIGWRIDYFLIDKKALPAVRSTGHLAAHEGSDHCPVWLEMDI